MIVFTTAVDEQESSDKEKVNYITFYSILCQFRINQIWRHQIIEKLSPLCIGVDNLTHQFPCLDHQFTGHLTNHRHLRDILTGYGTIHNFVLYFRKISLLQRGQ